MAISAIRQSLIVGGLLAAATVALGLSGCGPVEQNITEPEPASVAFPAPQEETEANLDLWLERLEVNSRELYNARDAVVASVGLKEGDQIADVGAGTGLYTLLFAEQVGASGRVFAEDIEPLFLDLINRRAEDLGLSNVTAVLGREDDVTLPAQSVDVVFIADSYHYFDDREAIMKSIYDATKPGGRLILVEYDIEPGGERPPEKEYVRFGKAGVISEVEFVGFVHEADIDVQGLQENYFISFRKPAE